MDQSHRFVQAADGTRLHVELMGDRDCPPVLFLHGGGQTWHSWNGAMQRLARLGYYCIAYDARGHGASGWAPDGNYSLGVLASDLALIQATLDRPAVMVGASIGGMTAFYAIGTGEVEKTPGLVMVDITPVPTVQGAERIMTFMAANPNGFASIDEAADAVAAYNPARPRPTSAKGLRRNLRKHADGRFHWHWDPALIARGAAADLRDRIEDMERAAPNVRLPTMLVRAELSDVVDDAGVEAMRIMVPQTVVREVAGAGHMVAGDRNDAFVEAVADFLTTLHPLA